MLIPCERCKRHISTREDACPFCRHTSAFAAAALSVGMLLAGCDAGNNKKPQGQGQGEGSAAAKRTYATLRGKVTDRNGRPLAGAQVSVQTANAVNGRSLMKSVPADADGRYTLDLIEPGAYVLYFGYGNDSQQGSDQRAITVKADEDQTLDVSLDMRDVQQAMPYGAPPARRRVV